MPTPFAALVQGATHLERCMRLEGSDRRRVTSDAVGGMTPGVRFALPGVRITALRHVPEAGPGEKQAGYEVVVTTLDAGGRVALRLAAWVNGDGRLLGRGTGLAACPWPAARGNANLAARYHEEDPCGCRGRPGPDNLCPLLSQDQLDELYDELLQSQAFHHDTRQAVPFWDALAR